MREIKRERERETEREREREKEKECRVDLARVNARGLKANSAVRLGGACMGFSELMLKFAVYYYS